MRSSEGFLTEKSDNCLFSHRKSDTKTKPGVSWIHVWSSGGVFIATFSLLKRSKSVYLTFIQRNSHFYIMPKSVSLFSCHNYFDEKTEIVSFLGKNLSMSDLNTMLYHYRWPHNKVTVTCTYHFDNGIALSTYNFPSTDGLSAFQLLLGEFQTVSIW